MMCWLVGARNGTKTDGKAIPAVNGDDCQRQVHQFLITQVLAHFFIEAAREEARSYLDRISARNDLMGVHTETEVIVGQAAASILSPVNTYHLDLIVLCSHGYTGVKRWLMGSVAEKVAYHSPVPVLVLREGGLLPADPLPDAENPWRVLVPLGRIGYHAG